MNNSSPCYDSSDNDTALDFEACRPGPKKTWSTEEDELLVELTRIHGTSNWVLIAESLVNRTGKQCRERYHNHLQANINKGVWTIEEDKKIVELQAKYGNQWSKISKELPGRTDNAVKNRWHAAVRSYNRLVAKEQRLAKKSKKTNEIKPEVDDIDSDFIEVNPVLDNAAKPGRKHPLVPFLSLGSFTSSSVAESVSSIIKAVSPRLDLMWESHEHHEHERNSERSDVSFSQIDLGRYLSPRMLELFLGPPSFRSQIQMMAPILGEPVSLSARELDIALAKSHVADLQENDDDIYFIDDDANPLFDTGFEFFEGDFNVDPLQRPVSSVQSVWDMLGYLELSPRQTPRSPRADNPKKGRMLSTIGENMKYLV